MEVRYCADQVRCARMNTEELRGSYLVEGYFAPGQLQLLYSDVDRAHHRVGGANFGPVEAGGGQGAGCGLFYRAAPGGRDQCGVAQLLRVEGEDHVLGNRDAHYIGKGNREVLFSSENAANPAAFYILSYPVDASYPTQGPRGRRTPRQCTWVRTKRRISGQFTSTFTWMASRVANW